MNDRLVDAVESPGAHNLCLILILSCYCVEMMSQAVKLIKLQYVVDVIRKLKMEKAFIFCRTKLDCDNLEKIFINLGGGELSYLS